MVGRGYQRALIACDSVRPRIARLQLKGKPSNVSIVLFKQNYFYTSPEIMTQKYPNRDFQISAGVQNSQVAATDANVYDAISPFNNGQR